METKNMLYLVTEYAKNGEIFGKLIDCYVVAYYWDLLLPVCIETHNPVLVLSQNYNSWNAQTFECLIKLSGIVLGSGYPSQISVH